MTCIPVELVRADWGAIATAVGVVASLGVVLAAFEVQRRQASDARRLIEEQHRHASGQGLEAVHWTLLTLLSVKQPLPDVTPQTRILIQNLDRHVSVLDFLLKQSVPELRTLEFLIEIRRDAIRMHEGLTALISATEDADHLFDQAHAAVLALKYWLPERRDRWLWISQHIMPEIQRSHTEANRVRH